MKFWDDDEDNVSEYELFAEDSESSVQRAEAIENDQEDVQEADITQEEYEAITNESAFDLNLEEADVVHGARVRLEQAKLYEMLINHNIFEGVDVNPKAIKKVQEEIKQFIIERLEILMGIKQEKTKLKATTIRVSSPFNDVEVEFLKALAYRGTHGKAAEGTHERVIEEVKPAILQPKKLAPKQLISAAPQTKTILQPVKKEPTIVKKEPTIVKKEPTIVKKEPKVEPVKKTQKNKTVDLTVQQSIKNESIRERKLTPQEIEALAKEDLKNMEKRKPFHKLTEMEKIERIKEVNQRHEKKKPQNALPIPDADALEAKYMMDQQSSNYRDEKSKINSIIANAIISTKS